MPWAWAWAWELARQLPWALSWGLSPRHRSKALKTANSEKCVSCVFCAAWAFKFVRPPKPPVSSCCGLGEEDWHIWPVGVPAGQSTQIVQRVLTSHGHIAWCTLHTEPVFFLLESCFSRELESQVISTRFANGLLEADFCALFPVTVHDRPCRSRPMRRPVFFSFFWRRSSFLRELETQAISTRFATRPTRQHVVA